MVVEGVEGPEVGRGTDGVGLDKTETKEAETEDTEDALDESGEGRGPRRCFADTLGASLSFALYGLVGGKGADLCSFGPSLCFAETFSAGLQL